MFKGKITKIPKNIDVNIAMGKKMYNTYSICPFNMLHPGGYETVQINSVTKIQRLKFWEIKKPKILYKKDHWKCLTCGAEWDSEWYPIEMKGINEFNEVF